MENILWTYTAFHGQKRIVAGDLKTVVTHAKNVIDTIEHAAVLIFEDASSRQIEIDFRGNLDEVLQRLIPAEPATVDAPEPGAKPGRPKLGVVAREITLLPRHWEWLASQPGGASVTLRKMVEEARKNGVDKDRQRLAHEATHRFMLIMAGNFPGFEEATRALDRKDKAKFDACIANWPHDIRDHVVDLAAKTDWETNG